MKSVDLIINAKHITPIVPRSTVLEDHAIVVDKGQILALLPQPEAALAYEAQTVENLPHHVVLPGFVNAHTHSAMVLLRGLADDLPLMDWLTNHIWPVEGKFANAKFVEEGTRFAIAEMLRSGTTCFNEHYFYPGEIAKVAIETGMRASVGLQAMDVPTPYSQSAEESLIKGTEAIAPYQEDDLISICIAPHAPYTVSDNTFKRMADLAREKNVPIHVHMHESADEIEQSLKEHHKRPLKRFEDMGILDCHIIYVHMTQVNDEDMAILKKHGGYVVNCPASNMKLASGFCPTQQLIDAGITMALGTDGPASNNEINMFAEMRLTALISKGASQSPTALPAATVLEMATLGGAKALGLQDKIGSIEKNKYADLIAVDMHHINTQPLYDPISHLVYATQAHQVSDVWVAGKQLLKTGELTTLDKAKLISDMQDWAAKIKA